MTDQQFPPTLLLHSNVHSYAAELMHLAGKLALANAIVPDHKAFIIRDIRAAIREINAVLAKFDSAEPALATESLGLLAELDATLAKHANKVAA